MTRTNRLPGGDDKHNDRTRQPHHRASPTPRAGANINRKRPSMDTTDDIRQPPPMPRPRPPLRRTKVVSSRRKTTPERRHHPIRRFGAFTRDEEGRARGDCEAAFKKGNDAGAPPASWLQRTAKGFPPIHPPERKHHRQIYTKGKRGSPRSQPRSPPIRRPRGQEGRSPWSSVTELLTSAITTSSSSGPHLLSLFGDQRRRVVRHGPIVRQLGGRRRPFRGLLGGALMWGTAIQRG